MITQHIQVTGYFIPKLSMITYTWSKSTQQARLPAEENFRAEAAMRRIVSVTLLVAFTCRAGEPVRFSGKAVPPDSTRVIYAFTVDAPAFTRVDVYVTTSNGETVAKSEYELYNTGYFSNGTVLPLGTVICGDPDRSFQTFLVPEQRFDLAFTISFLRKMPDLVNVAWRAYDASGKQTAFGVDTYDKKKGGPGRWYSSTVVDLPSAMVDSAPPPPASCSTTPVK